MKIQIWAETPRKFLERSLNKKLQQTKDNFDSSAKNPTSNYVHKVN